MAVTLKLVILLPIPLLMPQLKKDFHPVIMTLLMQLLAVLP
jgi:hypothetical protein